MAKNTKLIAEIESDEKIDKLAVLIDADNASASVIDAILTEVAGLGEAIVRRIYGDFTSQQLSNWKKVLNKHSIKPVQQFAYTTGKNATDSSLIIDAMDLMYTKRFNGFCLVSSDSDFTGLAMRIREEGLLVYGFGAQRTPEAFINACHKFIFTEILKESKQIDLNVNNTTKQHIDSEEKLNNTVIHDKDNKNTTNTENKNIKNIKDDLNTISDALQQSSDINGWSELGTFGSVLKRIKPDFDVRMYGAKNLTEFIKKHTNFFQYEEREHKNQNNNKALYIKKK